MAGNDELEAGSRIQVVVRVCPVLPHEASEPVAVACAADGRKVQVALAERETSKPALAAATRPNAKAYTFDACLTGSTTQAQLFDTCGIDELVEAAVDGYCCTVIINARQQHCSWRVQASCCEIYNEAVTDLLARNKSQQLQVRQGADEAFYVDGLTQREAPDAARALLLMADALSYRHTRAHQLNSLSSRSHCLITFNIASQELLPGAQQQGSRGGVRRVGKLVLVDLAGSERLRDTGSSAREAVRETGHINKSLFTLGQVLAALSVRGGCGVTGHVPYRDSRLTQLLWDGLRGGGRALMLACLSPLKAHAEESLNTLHFASMALRIKSQPVIMMDLQDQMVLEMRDMIKALQEDCRSLAGAITQLTSPGADVRAVLQALPPTLVQDALRYGSSSAPAAEQRGSRSSSMKGGRLRASSGEQGKVGGMATNTTLFDLEFTASTCRSTLVE
ncbi:hypothetical protein OEZ85_003594 [Tetradesmus obliquus]|uniref:Kinesin motor domain-containing protein n=1 Tax=Tetradesmus obliquus TaxID=3088 RepID=A0ABY8UE41_TETOB|nr:hypothetical protein OEZ85_003594 [Tetradesmus obliquus]